VIKTDYTRLATALPKHKTEFERQHWFDKQLKAVAYSSLSPLSYKSCAERLDALENITVPGTDELGRRIAKRILIDKIPGLSDDTRLSNKEVGRLKTGFAELLQDSPAILRKPIGMYIQALDLLVHGDESGFTQGVKDARESFKRAIKNGKALEAYLKELEHGQHSPTSRLLPSFLKIYQVAEDDEYSRELDELIESLAP
jgi:hypothetical protein